MLYNSNNINNKFLAIKKNDFNETKNFKNRLLCDFKYFSFLKFFFCFFYLIFKLKMMTMFSCLFSCYP